MRNPKPYITMSTDRKTKRKRAILRIERIKIIEYASIGLVILLFLGLAIRYGTAKSAVDDAAPDPTVSPVPTEDTSIRGMNVFRALEAAGFTVESSRRLTLSAEASRPFSMYSSRRTERQRPESLGSSPYRRGRNEESGGMDSCSTIPELPARSLL